MACACLIWSAVARKIGFRFAFEDLLLLVDPLAFLLAFLFCVAAVSAQANSSESTTNRSFFISFLLDLKGALSREIDKAVDLDLGVRAAIISSLSNTKSVGFCQARRLIKVKEPLL